MKKGLIYILVAILGLFTLATLFMSTSVILDLFNVRAKEGNYVPFVVWANFFCSLLYLVSLYGIVTYKRWSAWLLLIATIILAATGVALNIYIKDGGIYEPKTVKAMLFRTGLTLVFTIASYFLINKNKLNNKT
ncbi:MAG TPA: hypothetical protein PLP06_03110 [Saprospiraceae bacterium]|nr:hypothetical protein [Saprospiraceae bacterium]